MSHGETDMKNSQRNTAVGSMPWLDDLPKRRCPLCGGCGTIADDRELGQALKKHREASGVTLREVGRRLGFSAAYISDLEHGRRAWKAEKIEAFLKACGSSNHRI